MSPRIRGAIYVLFLAAFLVTAPIVVLYTAGFRYSPGGHRLVRIGLLSVSTVPKGAAVSVDGKRERDTTPLLIDSLLPGEHAIEIVKAGYEPWRKTLSVEESETTFVNKVVLFSKDTPAVVTSGTFVDASFDPSARFVALAKQETGWIEVWARELATGLEKLLLRLPEQETNNVRISWSLEGDALLIEELRQGGSTWTYTSVDGSVRVSVQDLLTRLTDRSRNEAVERVTLDPTDDDLLYVQTSTRLLVVQARAGTAETILQESSQAIKMASDLLILRQEKDRVSLVRQHSDGAEAPLAFLPLSDYTFLPAPEPLVLLMDTDRSELFLIETSGADRPILLNSAAVSAAWSPSGEPTLLYSTGFELHVYDARTHTDEVITRVSRPITFVLWHPTGSSALYVEGDDLHAIELDRRDGRNLFSIADMDRLDDVVITRDQKTAYLFGTRGAETGLFVRPLQTR